MNRDIVGCDATGKLGYMREGLLSDEPRRNRKRKSSVDPVKPAEDLGFWRHVPLYIGTANAHLRKARRDAVDVLYKETSPPGCP